MATSKSALPRPSVTLHMYPHRINPLLVDTDRDFSESELPPYFAVKNYILLASAVDDWDEADVWILAAEYTHRNMLKEAERINNTDALEPFAGLRNELDQLMEFKLEDYTGLTREERKLHKAEYCRKIDEESDFASDVEDSLEHGDR
jgi:hypothetical protein